MFEKKQSQHAAIAPRAPSPEPAETASSLSAGMTVVGKLVGDGHVTIYGRIEGELQASNVLIGEGAHVEGNVVAEELTIGGRVKGTIHAARVKLHSTAVVDGDIYHRSLVIDENAQFEGSSRRQDNPAEQASVELVASGAQSQAQPHVVMFDGNRKLKSTFDDEVSANPVTNSA